MPPIVNILGERVALGPIGIEHADSVYRWWNDFAIARNLHSLPRPRTLADIHAMFDAGGFFNKPATAAFAIYETASWDAIGTAGLMDIEYEHGVAEFFIVIGETNRHGQGLGTETARLVLDHAFTALGLSNVMLRVSEFNHGAIRSYEKAGFKPFGQRTRCHFVDGRRWNTSYMEAVAPDRR